MQEINNINTLVALDKNISINPKQEKIYNGLKNIGEEIACFYLDGIKIFNAKSLEIKSYLLAHIAREIECGLRDILVVKEKEEKKCKECGKPIGITTHIDSICDALGVAKKDKFAKEWHKLAKKFHKYSHRHGPWKKPRENTKFEIFWSDFENILYWLVGSYYNLLDRIDRILQYEKPTKEILNTLKNLLDLGSRRYYFFKKLKNPSWLIPLKEKGFLNSRNNPPIIELDDKPGFYRTPHWCVLNYLEEVAKQNKEEISEEITKTLVDIIYSIINYKDKNGKRIENPRTDWYIIKILSLLPIDSIEPKHIGFIDIALNSKFESMLVKSEIGESLVPKLLNNNSKDLLIKLFDVILNFRVDKSKYNEEFVSIIDDYWLLKTLQDYKSKIIKLCGTELLQITYKKIKEVLKKDKERFNIAWIPAIENHPQNKFPERYENQILCLLRDILAYLEPQKIEEFVKKLMKKEHPIFKRIAIHTINKHYEELNTIFWSLQENPLDLYHLKHEVYKLLKQNCIELKDQQINKFIKWIETRNYYDRDNISIAYRKKEWLSAVLESSNPKINKLYKKYDKVNPAELEHPSFKIYSKSSIGYRSPIKIEELDNMEIAKIVEYLNNFEEEKDFIKPSKDGLAEKLRISVVDNPEKYTKNINLFLNVEPYYEWSILRGLVEAWRAKKNFHWENVLEFILNLIESGTFWTREYKGDTNYRNWIISQMAELINDGTKDDDHAFEKDLLVYARKILLILEDKTDTSLHKSLNLVTSVSNSQKGKIYSAMINYSLRNARLYHKDDKDRWDKEIRENFEKNLETNGNKKIEFFLTLGKYLVNLMYLNKNWVIKNINKIFQKENNKIWEAAFTGYLFYSKIYEEIYFLLRKNNHYMKSIKSDFQDEDINKRVAQHICIGYNEGWESLQDENSLISIILNESKINHLDEIISFFWGFRNKGDKSIGIKIKPLWERIYKIASKNLDKDVYQKILSNLTKWLILVDKIDDDILKWLKSSVKYTEKHFDKAFLIEYLNKHVEKTPKKLGEIYLEFINSKIYPAFKKEHVINTVKCLYDNEYKEIADKICNEYGKNGIDFLREIYNKYKEKLNE